MSKLHSQSRWANCTAIPNWADRTGSPRWDAAAISHCVHEQPLHPATSHVHCSTTVRVEMGIRTQARHCPGEPDPLNWPLGPHRPGVGKLSDHIWEGNRLGQQLSQTVLHSSTTQSSAKFNMYLSLQGIYYQTWGVSMGSMAIPPWTHQILSDFGS